MAYNKNLNIGSNNVVNISGSLITVTGSLSGAQVSGTTAQFTFVSASVVSASQYLGLNLTASQISGSELNIDYIDFNTSMSANPSFQTGRLYYDLDTQDLQYNTIVPGVSMNLGQQLVVKVKNDSPNAINKGKLVRITGGLGINPTIATASWDNDDLAANTLGMMLNTTVTNSFGFVLLTGVIIGVDTNSFSAGEVLYLSSSGDYTNVKPIAPKHIVSVGEVVRVGNSSVGSIFTKIQNGYEIEELHNVFITSSQNGDLLAWNSSDSLWKNTKTLTGSYNLSGSLTSNGTITCLSLVETSTRRIKKDIHSMQSQIENIKKLNPVNYVRILDNKQEFGFIAEELKEVYPEFVIGDGVNYPKMVSVLVSAVQELTQKIEKQQDEIELLKNKKKTTRGKK